MHVVDRRRHDGQPDVDAQLADGVGYRGPGGHGDRAPAQHHDEPGHDGHPGAPDPEPSRRFPLGVGGLSDRPMEVGELRRRRFGRRDDEGLGQQPEEDVVVRDGHRRSP